MDNRFTTLLNPFRSLGALIRDFFAEEISLWRRAQGERLAQSVLLDIPGAFDEQAARKAIAQSVREHLRQFDLEADTLIGAWTYLHAYSHYRDREPISFFFG